VDDHRHAIALFRYSLVREAADPALSTRQRGRLVRQLAARDHLGPDGERVRVSRNTLDRWIRAWRVGGFEALLPADRSTAQLRSPLELLELAAALKREAPMRTSAQITQILRTTHPAAPRVPSPATIRRYFHRIGLHLGVEERPQVFGRFEAPRPNVLWTGDALHGPVVDGRKSYLFGFIDDHSRVLVGYRWGLAEDTLRLEAALRAGLAARGVPAALYVDNGSAFASKQLERACAVLGIRLIHSRRGQPAGRGKIERVFRTVREQFLVELDARGGADDLAELNRLFQAWVEGVYHRRTHSETGQPPLERFLAGLGDQPPKPPTPAELRDAFLWSERRQVTKTAEVSLYGNRYHVDPALVGASVELVFDPFDLTQLEVHYQGRSMGAATPAVIGRHVHPAAKPEAPTPPPAPTGIDYLSLVEQRLAAEGRQRISYALLAGDSDPHDPGGQGQLPGIHPTPTSGDNASDDATQPAGSDPNPPLIIIDATLEEEL
jgi:putative transposase